MCLSWKLFSSGAMIIIKKPRVKQSGDGGAIYLLFFQLLNNRYHHHRRPYNKCRRKGGGFFELFAAGGLHKFILINFVVPKEVAAARVTTGSLKYWTEGEPKVRNLIKLGIF